MPDLNPTPSEADTPTADRRPPRALLPLTLLLVILLRITAAVVAPQMLTTDADGYIAHAAATLRHHGFVGPFTGQPTAFRPPLYPLVLAAALACGLSPSTAVLLVSIGASVTCSTAVFWLARSMLGSHRAALLCALATAIDPLLLRYSIQPMTEVPCAALLTLACAAVAHAAAHGSQPRIQFAAGLLLAAAALTRPTVLLAGAGICLCQLALAMQSRRSPVSRPMPMHAPIMLAVGLAAGMTPWLLRNAVQFHAFMPATTHGGYTLALGNNPDFYRDVIRGTDEFPWDGAALDQWQQQTLATAVQSGINPADEQALDHFHYELAFATIRRQPAEFLQACTLRFRRFWALGQAGAPPTTLSLLTACWYLVLWTGLLLRLLQLLRHGRDSLRNVAEIQLWICLLAFVGTHLFYWTDARMRTPVMPLLIILATLGCRHLRQPDSGTHSTAT